MDLFGQEPMRLEVLAAAGIALLADGGYYQEPRSAGVAEEQPGQRVMAQEKRRCAELEAALERFKSGRTWGIPSRALADLQEEVWACRGKPDNMRPWDL